MTRTFILFRFLTFLICHMITTIITWHNLIRFHYYSPLARRLSVATNRHNSSVQSRYNPTLSVMVLCLKIAFAQLFVWRNRFLCHRLPGRCARVSALETLHLTPLKMLTWLSGNRYDSKMAEFERFRTECWRKRKRRCVYDVRPDLTLCLFCLSGNTLRMRESVYKNESCVSNGSALVCYDSLSHTLAAALALVWRRCICLTLTCSPVCSSGMTCFDSMECRR